MKNVDTNDALTGWRGVADQLLRDISSGLFQPGEKLPREDDLAMRYSVHRHTLRRAVAELMKQGVVDVRHGRGTFVQNAPISYSVGSKTRFHANIAGLNRQPGGRLLEATTLPAPVIVAGWLQIAAGAEVIRLDILRESDGVPLIRSEHWFPKSRFPDLAERFEQTQSITLALESFGVTGLRRQRSTIGCRMPTREEAMLLRQAPIVPVLTWESIKAEAHGLPVDYGTAIVASERAQLIFEREVES